MKKNDTALLKPAISIPPRNLNAELAALLDAHNATFVVTAFLQQGPLALDVSENLQRAGIVFQVGIVNDKTEKANE